LGVSADRCSARTRFRLRRVGSFVGPRTSFELQLVRPPAAPGETGVPASPAIDLPCVPIRYQARARERFWPRYTDKDDRISARCPWAGAGPLARCPGGYGGQRFGSSGPGEVGRYSVQPMKRSVTVESGVRNW